VASYYRQFLSDNQDGIARGAYILSREAYKAQNFVTLDGESLASGAKGSLLNNVKSVLVRNQQQLFIPQNDPSLVQAIINLNNIAANVEQSTSIKSVLLDQRGNVVYASNNNIGLKVRYFEGEQSSLDKPEIGGKIYDPLAGRGVSVPVAYAGGQSATDGDGFFVVNYMMIPCPGFAYSIKSPVTVDLNFSIFNPKGAVSPVTYSLTQPGYDTCAGYSANPPSLTLTGLMAQVAAIGVEASISHPSMHQYAFRVDTAVVNGQGYLSNGSGIIPTGDTTYSYQAPDLTPTAYLDFDFDGDGSSDRAVLGLIETQIDEDNVEQEIFKEDPNGTLQGIYLSSGGNNPASDDIEINQPDFIRVADVMPDFNHQGLLESISDADFKDTDILVFRESNGLLVTKRQGLDGREVSSGLNFGEVLAQSNKMQFTMLLRGPASAPFDFFGYGESYSEWQSKSSINPLLHQREADHLRPQEKLRIVAINRKTGYIGTARTTYGNIISGGEGVISMFANLVMRPPNLKIIGEREYDVESGLTQGQERKYLIGYEGAALASDNIIKITTQWFDHDGTPLPEGLGDFGYTGRLAKIVGVNTLGKDGSALAEFSIKPGSHTQQLQVGNNATKNEHYYVQVNGQSINENPTFDTLGAGEGPLRYRPKNYVPVLTPILDESLSWQQYLAYRQYQSDNPTETIEKPEPLYRWFYRPELQFSLYSLAINNIYSQSAAEGSQQIDIYQDDKPVIASSDDFINVLYDLLEQEIAPLDFLGAGQELVLALGEEEIGVTVGEGQQLIFNNLEHLASLDVEDFLSLRLYSNNDAANILWEYAFEYLDYYAAIDDDILPSEVDGAIEISADENEIDLVAHLIGFANRSEDNKYDISMYWKKEGGGSLEKTKDHDREYAIFHNTLTLPTVSGSKVKITAELYSDSTAVLSPLNFRVIPGQVQTVAVASRSGSQQLYVGGEGHIIMDGIATDQFGNRVSDGTAVSVTTEGAIKIEDRVLSTINGEFSFSVSGTDFPGAAQVQVRVGSISQSVDLNVMPVDIVFNGLPSSVDVNDSVVFSIDVSAGGKPAVGYEFDVWAQNARLNKSTVVTDDNGIAHLTLIAPPNMTTISVKAMTAMQSPALAEVEVVSPSGESPTLNNQRSKMVGDATTESAFSYTRWDNQTFSVNKSIAGSIEVVGLQGESVTVKIGDIFAPNRLTHAAYWMNDPIQATDEVGFSNGGLQNITLSSDTRLSAGNSYLFSKSKQSRINVAYAPKLKLTNNNSFVVDIKPTVSAGQIFNLGNALTLELLGDHTVQLTANTDTGIYTVKQLTALSINQWHQIAGSFTNDVLTLATADEQIQVEVSGSLVHTKVESHDLIIGQGYDGLINSLKWFNLGSSPLATFDDNTESTTIIIGESKTEVVAIKSQGKMHGFGSKLPMQSIAISTGSSRQSIELLSTATFETIATVTLSTGLVIGTQDFDLAAIGTPTSNYMASSSLYSATNSNLLFPQAYAYEIGFFDVLSIVGSLIGLDSLQVIWNQVGNMFAGRDVDIVAFSVAILDVLSLFPPAAPLKVVTIPAKIAIKLMKLGNAKAVIYLGGVMKKMFQQAKGKDFTLVYQGVAFFIIMADMALDEEAREGITQIAKMINSTDDFLDILDFLALADDEIAVSVAQNYGDGNQLFPTAHASVVAGLGARLGKVMKELAPDIAKMGKDAPKVLGELGRGIKVANKPHLKEVAFDKEFISGSFSYAKKVGITTIGKLLRSKHRIGPVTLIAIIAYLETELEDDRLFKGLSSYDKDHNVLQLRKLYVKSLPAVVATNNNYSNLVKNAHGAQFQLMQIAILHALAQSGDSNYKVVGIEVPRQVSIFAKESDLDKALLIPKYINGQVTSYTREIDIITGTLGSDEIWREMKSYKADNTKNRGMSGGITPWKWDDGSKKGRTVHRQYILDRIASATFARRGPIERLAKKNNGLTFDIMLQDIYWHFHDFETKSSISPKVAKIEKAFDKDATGGPLFYNQHVSIHKPSTFIMGTIDLFLTNSKSNLADAVRAEVNDRRNVLEEVAQ